MQILICGTAAAEGWPALFCHCAPCSAARTRGGKDLRSRSAYQIGDQIRIDFGPDSNLHQQQYGLAYEHLEHLLMSHSHWDHWAPEDIGQRRPGFSSIPADAILHIYGNEKVGRKLQTAIGTDFGRHLLEFHPIQLWEPVSLSDGITATPLAASHDRSELCVNWLLEQEGRRFLQGHDTGWWDDDTWNYLSTHPLNAVVLDCTNGPLDVPPHGHMGCDSVVKARNRLADSGALAPSARVIATHFSHNGGWLHEQLEEYFAPHGIEVACDGMTVPVGEEPSNVKRQT